MTFLNPWLLLMFPLAVLPLLLHLWMSRRMRTVEIATFRFLFDSYVQQRRRLKFLEALVAALRTLFLLALVLVVARPIVKHWSSLVGGDLGRDIILMADCSASMNARTDGVSSLERAKTAARAVAHRMSRGDRLTLIRVAAQPEELFSRFSVDADAIERNIDRLEVSPCRANLLNALNLVSSGGEDRARNALIYFLTDCQASGWRDLRDQNFARLLPEGARFVVVNVGSGGTVPNQAVLGDAPSSPTSILGLPVILRPKVANYAPTAISDLPLSVFIEEKEIARTRFTPNPGQIDQRQIVYVPKKHGVLKGRFEIPLDRFPDDDSFLFTLTVVPQLKVLLVRPAPADPADPYQNEALYLRTALTPGAHDDAELAGMAPGNDFMRSLDVREIDEPAFNAEQLHDTSVVVLANCGGLNDEQCALLRDFVFRGGGLLIFPGDRVNGATYNDHLFAVPNRPETPLTAARLGEAEGDPEDAETFQRFSAVDFTHPVMTVFDDPDAEFFRTAQFFRRLHMLVPRKGGNAWTLARFANGAPALVESRFGDGVTVVTAFPANARWTNLPMKPEFVPLALRLVGHLARQPELQGPSVVAAGSTAKITADPSWAPARAKVSDGAGGETALEFQWSRTRLLAPFEEAKSKGYYTVEVIGAQNRDQPKTGTLTFAVNLAPGESDFQTVGENQLRDWLASSDLTVVDASAQVQHLEGSIGAEREIWRPLIYLTLLIIGAEFLLSTGSGRKRAIDTAQSLTNRLRQLSPTTWINRMTGPSEPTE